MTTTINTTNATINSINAASYKELQAMAKEANIKANQKADVLRAELIALIPVEEETVVVEVGDLSITKDRMVVPTEDPRKADAKLAKWDKLVKAACAEYVSQSLGKSWALFYKATKVDSKAGQYMVKTKKLFGATGAVISKLYGANHNTEENIKQLLNVLVFRGYLNFEVKSGNKNERNIVFSATADQMNAMYQLSKQ